MIHTLELTRRGYIASVTLRNTKGIDLLVSNVDATHQIDVQVKTNHYDKREWLLNKKDETGATENLFYIFVILKNENERPDFFIVPSKEVAEYIQTKHQEWLSKPGKNGEAHQDSKMRKFIDEDGKYFEKWELIDI